MICLSEKEALWVIFVFLTLMGTIVYLTMSIVLKEMKEKAGV